MTARDAFLDDLAGSIPLPARGGASVLVGIDGVDGAGKTVLADDLAARLERSANVVRISIDGFHRRREERHSRGPRSPEGFWRDSYDYDAFRAAVVRPFRSGDGTYLPASHDLSSDAILTEPRLPVVAGSLVLVDGIFLHRPELRDVWDHSVFLDVPFEESARRMGLRDGLPVDPEAAENARYVGGQRMYLAECRPASRASVVVDYSDLEDPRIRSRRRPAE